MNNSNSNSWQYLGQVKFSVQLRPISDGKTMLPLILENGNTNIEFVCFSPLSDQLFNLQQGQTVSVNGYMKNRKCDNCGHYHVNLIAKSVSLDGGKTWLSDDQQQQQNQHQPGFNQPLQQQQQAQPQNAVYVQGQQGRKPPQFQQKQVRPPVQQSETFQQPVQNEQVAHLQQCQSQFQQQNQPQQSRDEFLSNNQYRQQSAQGQQGSMAQLLNNRSEPDTPVSPAGVAAQQKLYEKPIETYQQAETSLQNYQNHAQQTPLQDDSDIIDFDAIDQGQPF